MSELFNIYEDSLSIVLKNIKDNIDSSSISEAKLETLHSNISEAKRIIKQMDLEVTSNKNKISQFQMTKFRNYSKEVDSLNKKFLKIQDKYIQNKHANALSFDSIEMETNKQAQKMSLIEGEQWNGQDSIDAIKREAYNIESMGGNIATNLYRQGEQMKSIRENINGLNNDIDTNTSIVNRMLTRENRNKIIVWLSIGVGIFCLIFLIYWKLSKEEEKINKSN